jgi:hypothetical protein
VFHSLIGRWIGLAGVLALVLASGVDVAAETVRERLVRAEDHFLAADFSGALSRVDILLESEELRGTELRDAWILRGRCHTALRSREASRDFCAALRVDPEWRPDPALFGSDEMREFQVAERDCASSRDSSYLPPKLSRGTPWYKKKLVLGAIVGVAAGATVLALSGGDDGDERPLLPFFPESPTR